MPAETLYDKIWKTHLVTPETDAPAILYIDLHLIHEVTTPQAFAGLRKRGLRVRRPEKTVATTDHSIPTTTRLLADVDDAAAKQVRQLEANCAEFGIRIHGLDSPRQGIVHVIGPDLGLTQPGLTIVCGDSHTSTHGAFGALAYGIGTTEVEQVLATETCESIAGFIEELGGRAMPLNFRSTNVLYGEKMLLDNPGGEPIDLGFVGEVTNVDRLVIDNLAYAGQVPVIPSMCVDASGQKYNVNADTAAMAVAQSLGAEKLVFLSDVNGVRRDKNDPDTLIHSLTAIEARRLIADRAIEAGMIPKVEACLETLQKGVRKIHVIDGRIRHSLMLEIYTNKGIGTEIIAS